MEYLVTAGEMKQYDFNTIERMGIPGVVLMERAALAAFGVIEKRFGNLPAEQRTVFVMAGVGNNGGDGLALARLLSEAGYKVTVQCVGNTDKASEQWKMQRNILVHFPVSFCGKNDEAEYTIMVDALFGVGLSRNIEGEYAQAIESFNRLNGFKLSLDIPSGIHADTGRILGCAVSVDVTVTFGFLKRGLMFFPGTEYAGEVIKADIGIAEKSFFGNPPEMFFYNEKPDSLLPARNRGGNKGTFGKVLLVAGSMKMAGAAILSAKAVYRVGAGMVKVISPEENRVIIQETVPEALYGTYEDLEESLSWADVIAIGSGMGTGDYGRACLEKVIRESRLPMVMDADGLNLLAKERAEKTVCQTKQDAQAQQINLWDELKKQALEGRQIILTPHAGELARLLGCSIADVKEDLPERGRKLAAELHGVVVAKDARTFTCMENAPVCVNVHGNSGMATAGSGDVLAGIIAGLLAQGMEPFQAAGVGVYVHANAGDKVAAELGEHACMAGDLVKYLQS